MNNYTTYNRFLKIAYAVCIVLMLLCFAWIDSVSAESIVSYARQSYDSVVNRPNIPVYAMRPDACRTYNIGGVDATDGLSCDMGESVKREKDNTVSSVDVQEQTTTSTIVVINEVVKEEPIIVSDEDNNNVPEVVETESVKGNPGNDKPVGNAGEKCDKGMCENEDGVTGERGNSKND